MARNDWKKAFEDKSTEFNVERQKWMDDVNSLTNSNASLAAMVEEQAALIVHLETKVADLEASLASQKAPVSVAKPVVVPAPQVDLKALQSLSSEDRRSICKAYFAKHTSARVVTDKQLAAFMATCDAKVGAEFAPF